MRGMAFPVSLKSQAASSIEKYLFFIEKRGMIDI